MSDETARPEGDGKKPDKFHYNPGNMAGEKAGIVEEIEKQEQAPGRAADRRDRKPEDVAEDKQSDLDVPGGKGLAREDAGEDTGPDRSE